MKKERKGLKIKMDFCSECLANANSVDSLVLIQIPNKSYPNGYFYLCEKCYKNRKRKKETIQ